MFCLKIVEQRYTGSDRFLPVNAVMKGKVLGSAITAFVPTQLVGIKIWLIPTCL